MARGRPLLTQSSPTTTRPADIHIGHVQLRDLLICPQEAGVLNYVRYRSIVEHNLNTQASPRVLAQLDFTPNTLASLKAPGTDNTLLAAGGQEAELDLSLYSDGKKLLWRHGEHLKASINNSVLLTSLSLTRSPESSVEPRLVVSNNDHTVKFFNVPIRAKRKPQHLEEIGSVRFNNVPVNHSSISPDGRTLLSVGDSSKVFLHRITGGGRITFSPIATLPIPPPDRSATYHSFSLAAAFSTAFSTDGTKYAVASQEGLVAVWDVRSSRPFKVFQTDKSRTPTGNGASSSWLSDDPWEWTRGNSKAPGWSVRNVKFGAGGRNGSGKEIMTFTEHTSLLHVIDARTFEVEEILRMPPPPPRPAPVMENVDTPIPPRPNPAHYVPPSPSSAIHSPPPYIVLALEDTFRISSGRVALDFRARPSDREPDDYLVIPPLGDRQVDNDVQTFLGRHSIQPRRSYIADPDYEMSGTGGSTDDMEVDEVEADCISSHTPSRAASPTPSAQPVHVGYGTRVSVPPLPPRSARRRRIRTDSPQPTPVAEPVEDHLLEGDLDIAGTCFDPTGSRIYVATTDYVAEWRVNGSEKRWWPDDHWMA